MYLGMACRTHMVHQGDTQNDYFRPFRVTKSLPILSGNGNGNDLVTETVLKC